MLRGVSIQAWVRWLVALTMVSVGVMLAVAIHTVNHSALASFGQALDTLNGQASAQLVAPLGDIDDQQIDAWDSRRAALGIRTVSPALVVQTDRLTLVGLDFFKAAFVSSSKSVYHSRGSKFEVIQMVVAANTTDEPLTSTTTGYRSNHRRM